MAKSRITRLTGQCLHRRHDSRAPRRLHRSRPRATNGVTQHPAPVGSRATSTCACETHGFPCALCRPRRALRRVNQALGLWDVVPPSLRFRPAAARPTRRRPVRVDPLPIPIERTLSQWVLAQSQPKPPLHAARRASLGLGRSRTMP